MAAVLVLAAFASGSVGATPAGQGAAAPALQVEVIATGLEAPWALAFSPDGRIFVTERPGRIRVIAQGQLQPEPWYTVAVATGGEAGLMGLALHPDFANNGYVYIVYTYEAGTGGWRNRLERLRDDPATGRGLPDVVLRDDIPSARFHAGARLKFGPDGFLYVTAGDATVPAYAQDVTSLAGKILRFDADGGIPADNPWPDSPVYAIGLRNPQGLAWQPGSAYLYATDHGPGSGLGQGCCRDEVNWIRPGHNYGWPVITGDETRAGMEAPVVQSGESDTWAPSGATFVSAGAWAGSLLFVGLRGQALYRVVLDEADPGRAAAFETYLKGEYGRLRDVVEGPDGAIYVLTSNRDGRGRPTADDDRLLRVTVAP